MIGGDLGSWVDGYICTRSCCRPVPASSGPTDRTLQAGGLVGEVDPYCLDADKSLMMHILHTHRHPQTPIQRERESTLSGQKSGQSGVEKTVPEMSLKRETVTDNEKR